jgi:hypothetical protein
VVRGDLAVRRCETCSVLLIVVYFSATPAPAALYLVCRDTEGEEEFLVPFRGTALEFGVPAAARILVHSRGIQHLDPKLHVHDGGMLTGGELAEHPGQQPLLVLERFVMAMTEERLKCEAIDGSRGLSHLF